MIKSTILTVAYFHLGVFSLIAESKNSLTFRLQKEIIYEIGKIPKGTTHAFKNKTGTFPTKNFQINSAKLRKAWFKFQKLTNNYKIFTDYKTHTPKINYLKNKCAFNDLIKAILNNEKIENPAGKIRNYRWGATGVYTCGYSSYKFREPRNLAYALIFIRAKKYDMALVALFDYLLPHRAVPRDDPRPHRLFPVVKRLSKIIKHDWATICAGAICSKRPLPAFTFIGAYGGSKSIDFLQEFNNNKQILSQSSREYLTQTINCFVSDLIPSIPTGKNKEDSEEFSISSRKLYLATQGNNYKITSEEKSKIIKVFNNIIQEGEGLDNTELYFRLIKEYNNPILIPGLKKILKLPYPTMSYKAGMLLKEMGENVKIPEKPSPVEFQLFINGEFYKNTSIDYRLKIGPGHYLSSRKVTNSMGIICFNPDIFFDPTEKITRLSFQSPQNPFFNVIFTTPIQLDKKIEVTINTSSLQIKLAPQNIHDLLGKKLNITITPKARSKNFLKNMFMINDLKMDIRCKKKPLIIKDIQTGEYQITISTPKFIKWKGKFYLRNAIETLNVKLVPFTVLTIDVDNLD